MRNDLSSAHAAPVTPHDTASQGGDSLYVGGAGDVTIVTEGGETVTFAALPVGRIIECRFAKVMATGTTATLLVRTGNVPFKPTATVDPAVSGLTTTGSTLTTTNGTWIGQPTITFTRQWYYILAAAAPVALAGATGLTYVIAAPATTAGTKIYCEITATGPLGKTVVNSNQITVT